MQKDTYIKRTLIKYSYIIFTCLLLIFQLDFLFVTNYHIVYSQDFKNNINAYSRIFKSNDLNITMQFDPKTPIINKQTKIIFQITHLNGSKDFKNLTATITVLDNEGGLYKFGKQEVNNGKTFINYIFPNNVNNKIIIQLYKNNQGLALASYDIQSSNTSSSNPYSFPSENNKSNNIFSDLINSFTNIFKNFFS